MLSGWHTARSIPPPAAPRHCTPPPPPTTTTHNRLAILCLFASAEARTAQDAGPSLGQIRVSEDSLPINLKVPPVSPPASAAASFECELRSAKQQYGWGGGRTQLTPNRLIGSVLPDRHRDRRRRELLHRPGQVSAAQDRLEPFSAVMPQYPSEIL
jgi:hypothetical protein